MQISAEEVRNNWKVRTFRVLRMVKELTERSRESGIAGHLSVKHVHDAMLQKYEKIPYDLPEYAVQDDVRMLTWHGLLDQGSEKRESLSMTDAGLALIAEMAERAKADPERYERFMAERSSSPSHRRGCFSPQPMAA